MDNNLKELSKYLQSKENRKRCAPFEQLNQKYIGLAKEYADSFQKMSSDVETKSYRREYAKGGGTIQLGFYSPSSLDLVCGGCSRGKLYKRTPKKNTYDYEYIFDENDRMICAKLYSDTFGEFSVCKVELFEYKEDCVRIFGYHLGRVTELSTIAECQYIDGKISRYENALCDLIAVGKGCSEINVETFTYENGLMKTLYWENYVCSICLLNEHKYTFTRDQEGYLVSYVQEDLDEWSFKTGIYRGPQTCQISGKHK